MFASSAPRGGVRWLEPGRRRRRGVSLRPVAALVIVLLIGGAAAVYLYTRHDETAKLDEAGQKFAAAWSKRDTKAMWATLSARSRREFPRERFAASYRAADRTATVTAVRAGPAREVSHGRVRVPVTVDTRIFGTLKGTVTLPVVVEDGEGRVVWAPHLRLPGLRPGDAVRRRVLSRPQRAAVLAADGRRLDREPTAAAIAGQPPTDEKPGTGIEGAYDERLGGRPGAELRFGGRVVARVKRKRGRSVHATIRPGLQRATTAALGSRLGGVAVLNPRNGDVLALAGLAVSAPQPPGSTFKIVTLSAALQAGVAKPSSTYPVRTFATLSGVKLRNASNESCGGTLTSAFVVSCNSVFAPLGAKLGARRLLARAEAFGFNEPPRVPAAKPNTISKRLKDSLAVGAAAIGQDRDLATPLGMASVGATIAEKGVRARPRIVRSDKVQRHRAVRAKVAAQVREMMIGVVRGGTGTAAAIPGVTVAGKTGTAELVPTANGASNPKNTDAWFVAFAPAANPRVAVAVMLVGAGAGGKAAAPIAKQVLQAAL
jgi:penicillin-binding protein A